MFYVSIRLNPLHRQKESFTPAKGILYTGKRNPLHRQKDIRYRWYHHFLQKTRIHSNARSIIPIPCASKVAITQTTQINISKITTKPLSPQKTLGWVYLRNLESQNTCEINSLLDRNLLHDYTLLTDYCKTMTNHRRTRSRDYALKLVWQGQTACASPFRLSKVL
jgi:hypothetical protein